MSGFVRYARLAWLLVLGACAEGQDDPVTGGAGDAGETGGAGPKRNRDDSAILAADFTSPAPVPVGATVPSDFSLRLEAEQATVSGDAILGTDEQASGQEYVALQSSGKITFDLELEQAGVYCLVIGAAVTPGSGSKQNHVQVDGKTVATFATDESTVFYEVPPLWVELKQGANVLSLAAYWGWTKVDWIELRPVNPRYLDVEPRLVTPGAADRALRLMHYLVRQYGKRTLSGQQGLKDAADVQYMTDRYPALLGVDLIDYSPSRLDFQAAPNPGATENAIEWYTSHGGIVSVLWHWNAPSGLRNEVYVDANGRTVDASWNRGFYSNATTFDVGLAMSDPNSIEYGLILRDIDAIAVQLKRLEEAKVPVLWRPLHEASGGWFWWGARGAEPYLKLWNLMFDRLTNHHALTNLIWVWNGQHPDWYPGDTTVDIVSVDIYAGNRDYSPQLGAFGVATGYATSPKLIALSENGTLLDPDLLAGSGAAWSWFCTWNGADYLNNEARNEAAMFRKVYASDRVLSLDELPNLDAYPLPGSTPGSP